MQTVAASLNHMPVEAAAADVKGMCCSYHAGGIWGSAEPIHHPQRQLACPLSVHETGKPLPYYSAESLASTQLVHLPC